MRIGPLGLPEILLIAVVVLLIFGPKRLPDMAKGIGQSVREFRKGIRDMKDDIDRDDKVEPVKATVVDTTGTPMKMKVTDATVTAEEEKKEEVKS